MGGLEIVPIHFAGHRETLNTLSEALERTFACQARLRRRWFDPERAYDASRGQHNSTTLLKQLLDDPQPDADSVLGVTGVDLFIPVLTYVFGEAQLSGRVAVVSIHRLEPEVYGLPSNPGLLADRLEKEAVHELGHTRGLLHCADPNCVMHPSSYAEEIDLKSAMFCPPCLRIVRDNRGVAAG